MSFGGVLLGVINIGIVVAIFLLIGAIVLWFLKWIFNVDVPQLVQRLYIGIVALIALYMIVALLLGIPTWHVVTAS